MIRKLPLFALLFALAMSARLAGEPVIFTGMCDASAAAAIDAQLFVVADDEENLLRVYRRSGGDPIMEVDLRAYLGSRKGGDEADLEAAAPIGDLIFWIGSHGRNAKGKESPLRRRFFATRVDTRGNSLEIIPVGRPYGRLVEDLIADQRYSRFGLAAAASRAPKDEGGLNIEGLAATAEGHLLIGFRNPLPEGKAIVASLLNPVDVLEGERAKLGDPRLLDLSGLGIRSIGRFEGRYLIIAGPAGTGGGAKLYEWSGGEDAPRHISQVELRGLNPEGVVFRQSDSKVEFLVLSDDGQRSIEGQDCKNLKDAAKKRFRGIAVTF